MALGMEDYESHVRMASHGVRGVALPRSFFRYRIRPDSMSRAFNAHAQAFLQRRVIANNRGFYDRHGAQIAGLFAENGHGALATPPTIRTPANADLLRRDIPALADVDDALELKASRERLARALRARAYHGGPAWDYTVARLLLALDLQAEFAERSLLAATAREPGNGWYRLYAIIARLRAGHGDAAEAMWSRDFLAFCGRERGAVLWVAGLESLRGFPVVNAAFQARLGDRPGEVDPLPDPQFAEVRRILAEVASACATAPAARAPEALKAFYSSTAPLVSPQAATAMLNRWLTIWLRAGTLDDAAPQGIAAALRGDRETADQIYAGLAGEAEWLAMLDRRRAALSSPHDPRQKPAAKAPPRALSLRRHGAPRK